MNLRSPDHVRQEAIGDVDLHRVVKEARPISFGLRRQAGVVAQDGVVGGFHGPSGQIDDQSRRFAGRQASRSTVTVVSFAGQLQRRRLPGVEERRHAPLADEEESVLNLLDAALQRLLAVLGERQRERDVCLRGRACS